MNSKDYSLKLKKNEFSQPSHDIEDHTNEEPNQRNPDHIKYLARQGSLLTRSLPANLDTGWKQCTPVAHGLKRSLKLHP